MRFAARPRGLLRTTLGVAFAGALAASPALGATLTYGDMDVLGTGTYASDPTAGAALEGLSPGATTFATLVTSHGYPFEPTAGDFAGTDRIYAGSTQTGGHDGYSSAPRLPGPQVVTLDYAALVPAGQAVATLTLGIAADDFQFPSYGQPYVATLNGLAAPALTTVLNAIDLGGPVVRLFTIGLDPALDAGSHVLTLAIDQGGDGGDGWAVDYLTVGVTTAPVPEPAGGPLMTLGLVAIAAAARRHKKR